MANYRRLLAAAVIIPQHEDWMLAQPWGSQALGPKSVVELIMTPLQTSPITGKMNEVYVRWVDIVGRECKGWLARDTPMDTRGQALLSTGRDDLNVGAWDKLREQIFASGLNARQYICTKVTEQAQLTQLQAVIRELGGRIKNSDDDSTIITRAVRLTTGEDITMEDVTQERESAAASPAKSSKKGGKKGGKKGSKKAKGSVKTKRAPMIVTVGTALLSLGLNGKGKALAQKLSKGNDLGKKQLQELRDSVNEAAATAREKKQGKIASQLSSANRLVRRLARR